MLKLIRVFSIISLLLFIASSCKHYKVGGEQMISIKDSYTVSYFNTTEREYLYNAKINVFGNDLSGILVVKKLSNDRKRLALLSEFGNTLLDFEFVEDEVNVKYIMDDLNKRIIISKLKKYFQLLVHSEFDIKKSFDLEKGKTHISKFQGKRIFLNVAENNHLNELRQASIFRNKVSIHYYGNEEYADSILFVSKELPIEMRFLKRE